MKNLSEFRKLADAAKTILVLQPEKPDTDSLASSLALETFLGDIGKQVVMYCQDPVPEYIRFMAGWDRVTDAFPKQFDLTILVDAGDPQMIARTLEKHQSSITKKPFVVIDHHSSRKSMPFESLELIDSTSAANCEYLFKIAGELKWPVNAATADILIGGIAADTRNMVNPNTTADTIETVAKLVRLGGDTNRVYVKFKDTESPDPDIINFKGRLLQRVEFLHDNKIAIVTVPPEELKLFADRYDPAALIGPELQYIRGVAIAAVMRDYKSSIHGNKIKVSFRSRLEIAARAAEHFGGGGHPQAAGCTITGQPIEEAKKAVIKVLAKLVDEDETLQHA